jgi:multiple sugar transport system permease protein
MGDKKKSISYSKFGYIFSIPFVIAYILFQLYPILYTFVIAFTNLKGVGNTNWKFLTDDIFKNFKTILEAETFRIALVNTFRIWIFNFIPQIGMALLLTAWFTDHRMKMFGKGFFKVAMYMPNIITASTLGILFSTLFGYPTGPVNALLKDVLHIIEEPIYFLNNGNAARNIVIFIQFWCWYGYTMVQLISAVIGIDPSIFEAAELDGAGRWKTFIGITIPCIRPIMLFTLVTSLIGGLNMFDIPKVFLNGGPNNATSTAAVFIYNQAFAGSYLYARAAAASLIMFLIIVFFSAILFYILRDKDEAALNKLRKQQIKEYKRQQKLGKAGA